VCCKEGQIKGPLPPKLPNHKTKKGTTNPKDRAGNRGGREKN